MTVDTVAGAADIYLLVGLLFASVFTLIGAIQAGYWNSLGPADLLNVAPHAAFFNASRPTLPSDFIYYSYTTLSTVGYGDLTATSALGRILSTTEALIGQLYLVTVVAILVGKMQAVRIEPIRERRPRHAPSSQPSEPQADASGEDSSSL